MIEKGIKKEDYYDNMYDIEGLTGLSIRKRNRGLSKDVSRIEKLIVENKCEQAGGKVTDLNGEERRYDQDGIGCVLLKGILHNELLECVKAGKS